ncbi:MAG: M23 family metallopeptidase [Actinomycetales bacterium]|nr:M23 family metallopeptidase [Actinomycetales bacterium]HMT32155.1 M23 family metallopeptidase [Dermatophilaceae bacterium]
MLGSRGGTRRRYAVATAAATAVLCAVSFSLPTLARADTGDEKKKVDAQIEQLHDALEGTSAELAQAYVALQSVQAQLPAAEAALADAQAKARAAEKYNTEVGLQLQVAQANEARAGENLSRSEAALDSTQRVLDAFAADMFQGGGDSQLSVALGAVSADDFATRLVLADTVTSMTNEALNQLAAARADGEATRAYLVAVRAEVEDLKRRAEAALSAANASKAAAATAKQAVDSLIAEKASYAGQVESRKADELAKLQAAEAEQARLQAVLVEQARLAREAEAARKKAEAAAAAAAAAAGKSYTPPARDSNPTGGAFLSYPANGRITSEFGMRFHPILLVWKLHTGTDFGIPCGTPVYATAAGRVISAGWGGGYGNRIMIDHGIQRGVDLVTTYNHLSSIVAHGGSVARGQLIGYSGTTGYSTGCHLHFETLEDGSFVNPRTWI